MGTLPRSQKEGKQRFLIVSLFSSVLMALSAWSCWSWHQIIEQRVGQIAQAPIDPTEPTSFAFFNFEARPDSLTDHVLNVRCQGHEMTRQVEQYVVLQDGTPVTPLLILGEQELAGGQFPLATRFFESSWLSNGFYHIKKSDLPINLAVKQPLSIIDQQPRPPRWKKLSPHHFFWGNNPMQPQEGNIDVRYTCALMPTLSLWGSLDRQGVITPDPWLSGVSKLPAAQQKDVMIHSLKTFQLSSLAIHAFIINALLLMVLKERFMTQSWLPIGRALLSFRRYEVLLSPLVLLISPSFFSALSVCLILSTYGACCVFAKNQQELLSIERVNFYR